jgi:single-strand DNA-binding protein
VSRGLNRVLLIGHLGRDPETRFTPGGRPVTTFTLATGRVWRSADGERHDETEWFHIVAWGSLAEICQQHLRRGHRVYIEGRLQTRRWEDPEGAKHQSVEVVAREMIMLGEAHDPPGASAASAVSEEDTETE